MSLLPVMMADRCLGYSSSSISQAVYTRNGFPSRRPVLFCSCTLFCASSPPPPTMQPSDVEDSIKNRMGRRLNFRSRSIHRIPFHQVPDRFKDGDDAQDDYTAPPKGIGGREYMHQSIFSMIAAAGSKTDFHGRFDDPSDSDGEGEGIIEEDSSRGASSQASTRGNKGREAKSPTKRETENTPANKDSAKKDLPEERGRGHRRKLSDHRLLRSVPKLQSKHTKGKESVSRNGLGAGEELLPTSPQRRPRSLTPRAAPVLSRMIEAEARFGDPPSSRKETQKAPEEKSPTRQRAESAPSTLLSTRLMEIFGFEKPEKVIGEYACWLLQSVMLQGYMYITEGHVCFYAYLPKKSNTTVKSGYLSKRGRQNPKYNRYWCSLKGDVLSYYADPSNLYFPSGHVDLRYGISAALVEQKDKGKDVKDFTVTTDQRTYYFRADSAPSAKEWVRTLQKVIFRSHNEGDSVKISLPIENVIDIEENPMIEFAETIKVRVVESGETYAIDEYFFSFFNFGKDAFNVLRNQVKNSPTQSSSQELPGAISGDGPAKQNQERTLDAHFHSPISGRSSPRFNESVQSTLLSRSPDAGKGRIRSKSTESAGPLSPPRAYLDRSPPDNKASSDSFVHSIEQGTESSAVLQSITGTAESASQILNRSDVFQSPTINRLRVPSDADATGRRQSNDTARSASARAKGRADTVVNKGDHEAQEALSDSENEVNSRSKYSTSAPTLQELVKAGTYPLQRAAGLAGYLKNRSKRMSTLLATESMGYIEKVSGMWAGGRKHYGEGEGVLPDDQLVDPEDEERGCGHGDRFRAHFALPPTEKLQATYFGFLHRLLPLYGKIYISNRKFCFRSLLPGTRTKMILPLRDIENVEKEKGFRFGYHGLVIIIRGHEELFFEFNASDVRDDCAVTLHQSLESIKFLAESGILAQEDRAEAEAAKAEHQMLQEARLGTAGDTGENSRALSPPESPEIHPIFDDPRASIINFKPTESLRITCLTIGSRGDVQPYIALCKGLLAEGHRPKIATHAEFGPWVRKHGIDFAPIEGDPAELMRICVENGMFTYSFLKEASLKFRGWIDDLLSSAWASCQDSDLLIESPSAMAGIHIAEALRIPYFRAFTMPWSRTRAYPHAFAVPEHKMGGAYNYITYVMFDNVFWKAIAGQVNRWRKNELGLRGTNLDKMQPNKVPFLYNFSPSVVPPPLDFPDWIRITGYWFLNEGDDWQAPRELTDFIQRARADGKKLVYIGFGSIVVSDPAALTRTVVESVQKADVRCILSKGWSDRLGDPASTKSEIPLPPEIHQIQSAPHDWLFSQMDAVAHHGGAGTTGASLRAGVPTIVKPFFGDQFFFGTRIEDLGVGICMKRLNVSVFSRALWEATHSERMIVKARMLGEQIRSEDGVGTAIQAIYRDLEYAKTLARQRSIASATPFSPVAKKEEITEPTIDDDDVADSEEWTFVGDDTDIDISKRMRDREETDPDLPPPALCSHGSSSPARTVQSDASISRRRHDMRAEA
ncbi:CAZyme family GT1 [Paecilomyces variotii]|nr:CAZyme family GT1 [Paecilomyces variotii]